MSRFAVLLAAILVSLNAWAADATPRNMVGMDRPAFELPDLNDRSVNVSAWDGRILVLNFWATWCAPCRTEIPMLNRLAREYIRHGVTFVGIAVDYKPAVTKFMASVPINYPVLIGGLESTKLVEQYGNRGGVLPYTVIVGRDGKIVSLGAGALTEDYVRGAVNKLLGTAPANSP